MTISAPANVSVTSTPESTRKLRLNLGCGQRILPGYVNIDRFPSCRAAVEGDIRDLPYPDGCAEEILAEHLFEHLPFADEEKVWRECHRLLCPGGNLVLEVPDFEWVCRTFLAAQEGFPAFYQVGALDHYFGHGKSLDKRWGILTTMFFGNQNGGGQFHQNAYTAGKLQAISNLIGFRACTIETLFNKGGQAIRASLIR